MAKQKKEAHLCAIRLDTETYGWLIRYCDANEMSMSQVMRKALKVYRIAVDKKKVIASNKDKEEQKANEEV